MYLVFVILCLSGLVKANVVPGYSDYKDALAYLDKLDTDEIIEILRELIEERLIEERNEGELVNHNDDYAIPVQGKGKGVMTTLNWTNCSNVFNISKF